MNRRLIVIRPVCELQGRTQRMWSVLDPILDRIEEEGTEIVLAEKITQLDDITLSGEKVLFAVCLNDAGINMEYYRLLEGLKALARRLAFSANNAGCTFPGRPLVEATGSLGNFHVLSGVRGVEPIEVYRQQVETLVRSLLDFEIPVPDKKMRVLAIHASQRRTSNTMLLWDKVRSGIEHRADIAEISLRDGAVTDCRGCKYEDCLHFGEIGRCFYGGIITERVYPAILESDVIVMICPNYNDAVSANLTAFINRLTALFRA